MDAAKARVKARVKASVDFALASPEPPASLAKELEYPDKPVSFIRIGKVGIKWKETTFKRRIRVS
jgi:hypothetical protein